MTKFTRPRPSALPYAPCQAAARDAAPSPLAGATSLDDFHLVLRAGLSTSSNRRYYGGGGRGGKMFGKKGKDGYGGAEVGEPEAGHTDAYDQTGTMDEVANAQADNTEIGRAHV